VGCCPVCGIMLTCYLSVRLYVCASVCLCLCLCLWLWLPPPVCASVCLCFCVPVSVSVAVAVAATAACLCVCMSVLLCAGVCVCGCGCHRLSVRLYVCARVSHLPRMDCCGRIRWTMCSWVGARWGRLVGVRSHWYTQPSVWVRHSVLHSASRVGSRRFTTSAVGVQTRKHRATHRRCLSQVEAPAVTLTATLPHPALPLHPELLVDAHRLARMRSRLGGQRIWRTSRSRRHRRRPW